MNSVITLPKRIDLVAMLPKGATVAEVGVYKGHFSFEMLELPNLGHLYLVDPWSPQPGYDDPLKDTDHKANLLEAQEVLKGHVPNGRVTFLPMRSVEAAVKLRGLVELSAAYIDAAHDYDSVYTDLCAWEEVLAPQGVLMGHDYTENETAKKHRWGVVRAVSDFCLYHSWKLTHLTDEEFPSFCLQRK